MADYNFQGAFNSIDEVLSIGNTYLSMTEFWNLAKDEDPTALSEAIFVALDIMRISSILLQPFCPRQSGRVLDYLGVVYRKLESINDMHPVF